MSQDYRAITRYAKISPRKVKLVMDQIRGLPVSAADTVLRFSDKRAAALLRKTLKSARANAVEVNRKNRGFDEQDLYVAQCFVGRGPQYKTWLPRARGMATPLIHRSSHMTVCLAEKESN